MSKPLVIAFEGLFSYHAGFLRRGLLEPLAKKMPGTFDYEVYSWFWGRPKPPGGRPLIIVGHSFGGTRALRFAKEFPDARVIGVVTLDPRMSPIPATHAESYNIYREGRMHGYVVPGAMNLRLPKSVRHTEVPYQPEAMSRMIYLLKLWQTTRAM